MRENPRVVGSAIKKNLLPPPSPRVRETLASSFKNTNPARCLARVTNPPCSLRVKTERGGYHLSATEPTRGRVLFPENRVRRERGRDGALPACLPASLPPLLSTGPSRGLSEPNDLPAGLCPRIFLKSAFFTSTLFFPLRFSPTHTAPPPQTNATPPAAAFPRPQASTRRHGNPRPARLPLSPRFLPRPGGPSAGSRPLPLRSGPGALLPPPLSPFAPLWPEKRVPRWLRQLTGRVTGARRPPPWSGVRRTTPSPTTSPSSVSGRPRPLPPQSPSPPTLRLPPRTSVPSLHRLGPAAVESPLLRGPSFLRGANGGITGAPAPQLAPAGGNGYFPVPFPLKSES